MDPIAFFILTAEQRATAISLNNTEAGILINPRLMDAVSPGSGTNINGLADGYAVDDPVTLTGKYVAPYRIIADPDYIHWVPEMVAMLLTLPVAMIDPDVVFAPPEDV